jgi:nicotinic acid mononucleotide adenylyltransferase
MVASWKLARDRYLAPLGEAVAVAAGFFDDGDDRDAPLDDVRWLCTPLPVRAVSGAHPVVLLSTGGFCPIHAGHLEMMERARAAASAAGCDVLAGYLSPGHDAYVRLKCGEAAIPASERLAACAAAIADRAWLYVDPWEALHRRVAVNYTDVAARLRAYLRAHVDPRVEVLYVCGGDNARFAQAFVADGGCVVVGRPGAEAEQAHWRAQLAGNPRILWAEGDRPEASRAIRAAGRRGVGARRIVMRVEDARAVRTLARTQPRAITAAWFAAFQGELGALLAAHASLRHVALGAPGPRDTISLDPMLPSAYPIAISRCYALGGYQRLGYTARPGARPLPEQIAAIPPGDYTLADDDAMTGGTLDAVRALLPAAVRVRAVHLAIAHDGDEDVVDGRDFLLGADDAGLVVQLPRGVLGRAPYVLPYVDPAVRCSIPPPHARAFSIAVWELNERVLAATGLRVRDLPAPAGALFAALGSERALADVCRWHIARLRDDA